jgi:hypothetical protein
VCGEFYDWLQEQGYRLCTIPDGYDHTYFPTNAFIQDLLAQFFEIDQQKIELEKRAMLDECRKMNTHLGAVYGTGPNDPLKK